MVWIECGIRTEFSLHLMKVSEIFENTLPQSSLFQYSSHCTRQIILSWGTTFGRQKPWQRCVFTRSPLAVIEVLSCPTKKVFAIL